MANYVTTGLYDFDPQGTAPANLVRDERHILHTPGRDDYHFLIPKAAPFFANSLVVRDHATQAVLVKGVDYVVGHHFIEAMHKIGQPVVGSIRFLRRDIVGTVSLDYQTIGGHWGFSDQAILAELSNKLVNPLRRAWAQIDTVPATFPVIAHVQPVDSLIGSAEILEALEAIVIAINNAAIGATESHLADKTNPHSVTKAQVGLGQVENYPPATGAVVDALTSSSHYVTPQSLTVLVNRLRGEIGQTGFDSTQVALQVGVQLTNYMNRRDNPNQVTKAQVGLGQVADYPPATKSQVVSLASTNTYVTPNSLETLVGNIRTEIGQARQDGVADANAVEALLNAFIARRDNPHQVTQAQVGLNQLRNFPVADEYESRNMVANNRYVTPEGVGYAIDEFYTTVLAGIIVGDPDNPIGVTKEQIGLGQVENYPPATVAEAVDGTRADRYVTPIGLASHVDQRVGQSLSNHLTANNPHGITATMLGAATVADLNNLGSVYLGINSAAVNANNAFGLSKNQLLNEFSATTVANSELLAGLTLDEVVDYVMGDTIGKIRLDAPTGANSAGQHFPVLTYDVDPISGETEPMSLLVTTTLADHTTAVYHVTLGARSAAPQVTPLVGSAGLLTFATVQPASGDGVELWIRSRDAGLRFIELGLLGVHGEDLLVIDFETDLQYTSALPNRPQVAGAIHYTEIDPEILEQAGPSLDELGDIFADAAALL